MSVPLFVSSCWRENALALTHEEGRKKSAIMFLWNRCFFPSPSLSFLPPFSFSTFLFFFSFLLFSFRGRRPKSFSLLYQVALLPYRGPAENEKPGQHLYVKSGPGGRGRADTHDTFEFFIPIQAMGALLLRSVLFHSDTHMNLTDSDMKDLYKIRTGK